MFTTAGGGWFLSEHIESRDGPGFIAYMNKQTNVLPPYQSRVFTMSKIIGRVGTVVLHVALSFGKHGHAIY